MATTYKKIKYNNNPVQVQSAIEDGSGNTISSTYATQTDLGTTNNNVTSVSGRVSTIEGLIPSEATTSNQLADKSFVNSSVATNTANFLGTYNIVTDLGLTTSATEQQIASAIATKLSTEQITVSNNDYVYVAYPDATVSTQYDKYDRYKASASGSTVTWEYEYTLNNSSFTAEQWASINSGITSTDVTQIGTNATNIGLLQAIKYGKTLSVSGTSLSLKDQDGTVLSTVTTQDTNDNQKVKAGSVTFGDNDVVNFVGGTNVTVTGDSSNDTITISATDTTYGIADSSNLGLVKSSTTGVTANRDYNVEVNNDGTMKVNVPWTDTENIPVYEGTQAEPIIMETILGNLSVGNLFFIKGYVRTISNGYDYTFTYPALVRYNLLSGGTRYFTIFGPSMTNGSTFVGAGQHMYINECWISSSTQAFRVDKSYNTYEVAKGYNGTSGEALTTNNTSSYTPTGDYNPATKKYVDDNILEGKSIQNEIAKFFVDNPSFKYNGSPVYLQDIAGKNLTDADVQSYLTALFTKYGNFTHNQDSRIPYTATRWAILQSANTTTYTLYYILPDQDAIWHLVPDASYDFVEGLDGLMDNVSAFKNDVGYLTSSTGVTSVNGSIGAIIGVAMSSDLGTQATFSLSGTTLTITPK